MSGGKQILVIDFDGTWGYASSFLSELAVRIVGVLKTDEVIRERLELKSEDEPGLIDRFWGYIDESLAEEN